MKSAPLPANEVQRLSALYDYNILDTLPEKEFDDITRIASQICQTPISLVSIIDEGRQWFKSAQGIEAGETPRELAFCAHAILNPSEIFEISDSQHDDRFFDNPYVTGEPYVSFYAGIPLVTDSGHALGTLCVIDNKPKHLTDEQKKTLQALANQVVALLELRYKSEMLRKREIELMEANAELERFAYVAAHDLKSPCNQITALSTLLQDDSSRLDDETKEMVQMVDYAAHNMRSLIDGILRHSRITNKMQEEKENFTFGDVLQEVKNLLPTPTHFTLRHEGDGNIWSVKTAWIQIVLNLLSNAIKYNDKENAYAHISFKDDERYYRLKVSDNGIGIPSESQERIFDLFEIAHDTELYPNDNKASGIGLHTVKRLVGKLDGKIRIMSEVGVGTTFSISIRK